MKKNTIQIATTLALLASSIAHAQDAVQWKLSDGGNGHWYQMVVTPTPTLWVNAKLLAESMGGHLASIRSEGENDVCLGVCANGPILPGGSVWLGAVQPNGEASAFAWVTGEPFDWTPGCGFSNSDSGCGLEDRLTLTSPWTGCPWNDVAACWFIPGLLVEWDADCNNDGIVDYGQCRDGSLPDYNGNNVPDCCERSEACVAGDYPMQWTVADGGNGHWYQIREMGLISWSQSRAAAQQVGGYLATLTTASESAFVARLKFTNKGVNLGGYQDRSSPDFSEPSGGWRWVTGEPWSYTNWLAGEPNNAGTGEDFLMFAQTNFWGDKWADQGELCPRCEPHFFAVEWSTDCNNDNIVDYGQILNGQLTDANTNGIPDICEGPTCHDIDLNLNGIVDGADLGVLLAFWGPASPAFPRADINGDGLVNGADLGIVLAFWGPCPN